MFRHYMVLAEVSITLITKVTYVNRVVKRAGNKGDATLPSLTQSYCKEQQCGRAG